MAKEKFTVSSASSTSASSLDAEIVINFYKIDNELRDAIRAKQLVKVRKILTEYSELLSDEGKKDAFDAATCDSSTINLETLKLLAGAGVDLTMKDSSGANALHRVAIIANYDEEVDGWDEEDVPNDEDFSQARREYLNELKAIVDYLIDEIGLDVNDINNNNETPLQFFAAALSFHHTPFLDIGEHLLKKGADPNIKDNRDRIADDYLSEASGIIKIMAHKIQDVDVAGSGPEYDSGEEV